MQEFKFSTGEIDRIIRSMVVLIDSREKKNEHIVDYFRKNRVEYRVSKLDYGDYSFMLPAVVMGRDVFFHRDIYVERKNSLEELSHNFTQEREAFEKEFLRAGNDGAKGYLMVEDAGGYSKIISHGYDTGFSPKSFIASLRTWESRFDIAPRFIDKRDSGYFIASTFRYYAREVLR